MFQYQGQVNRIDVSTDTDYAGCELTRKSTSGGVVQLGAHMIKSWSSTQGIVSLSSGEAEYYGLVKGSTVGIGIKSMMNDFGGDLKLRVSTDASAAKGIASRRGLGKVRHIDVAQLWVQDKVLSGDIELRKIKGEDNLADSLTKYVDSAKLGRHLEYTAQLITAGRHVLMPEVAD